jgi:hypothetical protein
MKGIVTSLEAVAAQAVPGELNRLTSRAVFVLAACASLLMLVANSFYRESYSGDEGFYGVIAANMVHSPDYIVRPSYYPAGDFTADKDGFAHPPFNSYLYALSLWLFGGSLIGPEVVNCLSLVLLLFFVYRLLSTFNSPAAQFSTVLLAVSPAILLSYSQLEAEPLMCTLGVMSLYYAVHKASGRREALFVFLSGLFLGFAYAFKLWLCGPLGLAVATGLIIRTRPWAGHWRPTIVLGSIFTLGFVIPSGAHLLAVWLTHPEDVKFWLNNIYFGVFTHAGISGSKVGGDGVRADWVHPVWYYAAALYRDYFFLLPILLVGLRSAVKDARAQGNGAMLCIIAAGVFGLAPLSLMKVKEPLYVLSCAIFIYLLAGFCLAAIVRRLDAGQPIDAASRKLAAIVTLGLLILFPLAYARGIQHDKITAGFVLAHTTVFGLFLTLLYWSQRKQSAALFVRALYVSCAIALVGFGFYSLGRPPRDRMITRLMLPYLQANSPKALSMIASNFKCYQLYSFHHGCYWHELPADPPGTVMANPAFQTVRAFILDPEDLAKPELTPWITWLDANATEKTRELDAQLRHPSGFRFFVRETATSRADRER